MKPDSAGTDASDRELREAWVAFSKTHAYHEIASLREAFVEGFRAAAPQTWRSRAEKLWDLLDEVDTCNDAAKADDATFRRLVNRYHPQRFAIATSDGYSLSWTSPNQHPSPPEPHENDD